MPDKLLDETVKELSVLTVFVGAMAKALHIFLGWLLAPEWLTATFGTPVAILSELVLYGLWIVFWVRFLHYLNLLRSGDRPVGDLRRDKFDSLRARLQAYRSDEDQYARLVRKFLDWVDRFFDGPPEMRAGVPPPWTASAYDRCLLLALIYPLACIYLIWAISGEIGSAEQALRLTKMHVSMRVILIAGTVALGALFYRLVKKVTVRENLIFAVASLICLIILFAISGREAGAVAVAIVVVGAVVVAGSAVGAGAGSVAGAVSVVVAGAVFGAVDGAGSVAGSVAVAVAVAVVVIAAARNRNLVAYFLGGFTILMCAICLGLAWLLANFPAWRVSGPLLLFLGLLTLVNAPFDWASLGLTRFLLRRGLAKGGIWPYLYAFIDAFVGTALITILAVAITVAIDGFNALAVLGGGDEARVFPPMREYLAQLRANPGAHEYWWLYATVLSTLLPSVINLFLGGLSFARGNFLNSYLLSVMREGQAVPAPYCFNAAIILTLQGAFALVFAVAVQAFLGWLILHELMPMFRLGPLQAAEAFAF